jgi:hypothetical protein
MQEICGRLRYLEPAKLTQEYCHSRTGLAIHHLVNLLVR